MKNSAKVNPANPGASLGLSPVRIYPRSAESRQVSFLKHNITDRGGFLMKNEWMELQREFEASSQDFLTGLQRTLRRVVSVAWHWHRV